MKNEEVGNFRGLRIIHDGIECTPPLISREDEVFSGVTTAEPKNGEGKIRFIVVAKDKNEASAFAKNCFGDIPFYLCD